MNLEDTTLETAPAVQTRAPSTPKIGEPWPGQGGIYAGVTRGVDGGSDCHLILAIEVPEKRLAWKAGNAWAAKLKVDEHADFHMPTRDESALLYANVRDNFDPSAWYWTGTQYSDDSAFDQGFDYGYQDYGGKKYEGRVRAVRRFAV